MEYTETDLINNTKVQDELIDRIDVLDKVGNLMLLPNTSFATTEQVVSFYDTSIEAINQVISRHEDELISDGFRLYKRKEIIELLNIQKVHLENVKGKTVVTVDNEHSIDIPNRGLRLFTKRAVLRVGMLLRDSEVAKEVRTRLLDIIHDVETGKTDIVQGVVNEITEEQQLMLDRVDAEMSGDFGQVCIVNAKLFALKNKRIKELEDLNREITAHSLTIEESRSVINRIVRCITNKKYGGVFGNAWNDLYSLIDYKLNINIRARKKDKYQSFLDTLSENEIYEVEEIARNWAISNGLNLNDILSLDTIN